MSLVCTAAGAEVQMKLPLQSASELQENKIPVIIRNVKDLEKVKDNGYAIMYIKNPSMEDQLAAVRGNGWAIMHIKNPSMEVQLAAVRENWCAIRHIKNPSEEIQLIAALSKDYND